MKGYVRAGSLLAYKPYTYKPYMGAAKKTAPKGGLESREETPDEAMRQSLAAPR
jgi:hypothetical protein